MLSTIKDQLEHISDTPFREFYQDYVASIENDIITLDINRASSSFKSIEDIPGMIKSLNKLVEGLK